MSTEEVKIKQQQVGALSGQQYTASPTKAQQDKFDANIIAEAFKRFAKINGIILTTETFVQILNSHPEILNLPQDKQATELLKLFNGEKPAAQQQEVSEQIPTQESSQAQQTPAENTEANPFGSSIQSNELFSKIIASIQQEEIKDRAKSKLNLSAATAISAESEVSEAQEEQEEVSVVASADKKATKAERKAKRKAERAARREKIRQGLKPIIDLRNRVHNKIKNDVNELKKFHEKKKAERQARKAQRVAQHQGKSFENKSKQEKVTTYEDLCAKNLFIHSSKPPKTEEDWNNLSAQEKSVYTQKAQEYSGSKSSLILDSFKEFRFKIDKDNETKATIEYQMAELQTAEYNGISIEEFNKLDKEERLALVADYVEQVPESKRSFVEKEIVQRSTILKDAFNYQLEKNGESGDLSCHDVHEYINKDGDKSNNGAQMMGIVKEYLEDKVARGEELSDIEKSYLKDLNKEGAGTDLKEKTYTKQGSSEIRQAITNSENFDREAYEKAGERGKAEMVITAALQGAMNHETGTVEPEAIVALYKDINEHVETEELKDEFIKQIQALPNSKEIFEYLSKQGIDAEVDLSAYSDNLSNETIELIADQTITNYPKDSTQRLILTQVRTQNEKPEQLSADAIHVAKTYKKGELSLQETTIYGSATITRLDESMYQNTCEQIKTSGNHEMSAGFFAGAIESQDNANVSETKLESAISTIANDPDATEIVLNNGYRPSDFKNSKVQEKAFGTMANTIENDPDKKRGESLGIIITNDIPKLNADVQLGAHQKMTNSKYEKVVETAASNIPKYDSSVQVDALKATYNSGNSKAVEIAASNIHKMDSSVQAEAMLVTFATNNTAAIEKALLQVDKMDLIAVSSIQDKIDAQIQIMENKQVQSIIEAYAKRQVNKEFGMKVDNNSDQFKTRFEKYLEKLKGKTQSEIYSEICNDIQYWSSDMQAAMLEKISKYCPKLFAMMINRYGIKLLNGFGLINISTKNEILMQMLKSSNTRAEAMEYLKSNPNSSYSDEVKELYNKLLAEKTGEDYDKIKAEQKSDENDYLTVLPFGSQSGFTKTNFDDKQDSYWKTKANLNYYMA